MPRLPNLARVPTEALEAALQARKRGPGQPPKWVCCLRCRAVLPVSLLRQRCPHEKKVLTTRKTGVQ